MKTVAFITAIVVVALIAILLFCFEKKKTDIKRLMLIVVLTALSVMSRIVFAAFPGFKPVTAIVIIAGMYLGADAGFYCGALTALITNMYFGQGAFTPFQMLCWGAIGIIAGVMGKILRRDKLILVVFGIFAGIAFSFFMDIYTVIWTFGNFSIKAYLVMVVSAVPFTVIYAVSNVVFLLVLAEPIGKKIERISAKYLENN